MVGILLVSHGKMAEGIKDSMQLIVGDLESVDTVSLSAGQDFEGFKAQVSKKIRKLDQGKGVLVYVDLYGASPYNAAMLAYPELKSLGINIKVITGMNLPMILEIVFSREEMCLEDIYNVSISSGRDGILEGISQATADSMLEEDGDY